MLLAPDKNCFLCPRLFEFRSNNRKNYPDFFNSPVPAFGSLDAELLVVGLAPGLKGANKSGRPFTGDYAGLILYHSLKKYGFAEGEYAQHANDGFELTNCRITNAVRCVPPDNKPEPAEIKQCNNFLREEIRAMPNLKIIISLGAVSHNAVLKAFAVKISSAKFRHAKAYKLNDKVTLLSSYHTSRYNINTGVLTQEMFDEVIKNAAFLLRKENHAAAASTPPFSCASILAL